MDYITEAQKNCQLNESDISDGTTWCPPAWDGLLCWPMTPGGELVSLACPEYYREFDPQKRATRRCLEDGRWYWSNESNATWTNYTECFSKKAPFVFPTPSTLISSYLPIVKAVSQIGYSVSLITLIVAFCILATFKGLRCPRNKLHMHLFLSFMLRACTTLFKDLVTDSLSSRLVISETSVSETVIIHQQTEDWTSCRAVTSLWQYFLLANYCWILMEGLYLHNLIFLALFTDSSSIALYIVLGWGLPALFVLPWIFVRAAWENTLCWTTNSNPYYLLLIRGPTTVSILINFALFINIVRVLLSKLQASICEENKKFRKWAKSTLVLVPLFGVHYAIFIGMSYVEGSEKLEIAWLFGDQLFASFQGFFVAVLYCFLNGEVRTEISKKWRRWWRSRKSSPHNPNFVENNAYGRCSTLRGCFSAIAHGKNGYNMREGDYSKRESGVGAESCVTSTLVTLPADRASYCNNSIADSINRGAQNNRKVLSQSSDIELHSFNYK